MDGIYANAGAAAVGQARPATPDEMYKLKQMQANQCAPAPSAPQELPSTAHLVQMLEDNARNLYDQSHGLVDQAIGSHPMHDISRERDGLRGQMILALRYLGATADNISSLRNMVSALLVGLLLCGVAFAQKPAAPAPAADDNIACSTKVQPTTGFTECEMLRLSNYMNQMTTVRAESDAKIKPIAEAGNEFIGKVVARNPGKQYETASQQFPLGRLVPIPAPVAPTDPHTGQPAVAPTAAPTPAPAPATPTAKK